MGNVEIRSGEEIIELLQWYKSVGVDICVDEKANNQFVKSQTGNLKESEVAPVAIVAAKSNSGGKHGVDRSFDVVKSAQLLAQSAKSLSDLQLALQNFSGFALKERATKTVFGSGDPNARIMLVGKAPGREEDMLGTPFAGKGGELLDAMLLAIGITRSEIFLCNIVPWRPPGNRDLAPQEIAVCMPFLHRQIELVRPDFIISLGDVATKSLLGDEAGVLKLNGQWSQGEFGSHKCKIIASLHPDFLLKQPAQKNRTWRDLCKLRHALKNE